MKLGGDKKKRNILGSRYISYKEGKKKEGKKCWISIWWLSVVLQIDVSVVFLCNEAHGFVTDLANTQAKVVHILLHPKLLVCPNKAPLSAGCWQYFCPRFGSGAITLRCWAWSCTCIRGQQQGPSAFCLVSRGYITNILQSGLMTPREQ